MIMASIRRIILVLMWLSIFPFFSFFLITVGVQASWHDYLFYNPRERRSLSNMSHSDFLLSLCSCASILHLSL